MARAKRSDFTDDEWRQRKLAQKRAFTKNYYKRTKANPVKYAAYLAAQRRFHQRARDRDRKLYRQRQCYYKKLYRLALADNYLKQLITQRESVLRRSEIPEAFIKLYRANLRLKRAIKGVLDEQNHTHRRRPAEAAG